MRRCHLFLFLFTKRLSAAVGKKRLLSCSVERPSSMLFGLLGLGASRACVLHVRECLEDYTRDARVNALIFGASSTFAFCWKIFFLFFSRRERQVTKKFWKVPSSFLMGRKTLYSVKNKLYKEQERLRHLKAFAVSSFSFIFIFGI